MRLTVAQLAERIDAELAGDDSMEVSGIGPVEAADESTITFVTGARHMAAIKKSRAAAVIVDKRIDGLAKAQLIVKNVNAALIEVLNIFAPKLEPAPEGVDPTAKVGRDVKIAGGVSVGPFVVIGDKVEIGENTVISSGCRIGEGSRLGKNCRLDSNIVVYHNCTIGNNVVIQANCTIGSTGFGYCCIDGVHRLIPHNGGVIIEDFVEIGANSCIDRAKFGNTTIGAGTKIDNLVQIAHNVIIGRCCLIAGLVGIAGSCKLGDGVVVGGQAGLADNIEIGDGVMIGAGAGVVSSVKAGRRLFGTPAVGVTESLRRHALVGRLPEFAEMLKQLDKRIKRLEAAEDHKS
jgi:UDP-3-O-[3-hydroxymyristoyl] glucosamine N-acyltransferase